MERKQTDTQEDGHGQRDIERQTEKQATNRERQKNEHTDRHIPKSHNNQQLCATKKEHSWRVQEGITDWGKSGCMRVGILGGFKLSSDHFNKSVSYKQDSDILKIYQ